MTHECVIGLISRYVHHELVTLSELKQYIEENIVGFNAMCRKDGLPQLMHPAWTLRDYADKRKATNLTRFNCCPCCGKKIDWKAIRKEDAE